jgi:hypothetical protein
VLSIRSRLVLALVVLLPVATACGPDRDLVVDGRPNGAIVLSTRAGSDERLAASDLQTYIRKMSGAELPVQAGGAVASDRPVVRIGLAGSDALEGWRGEVPSGDGFVLETRAGVLWIVGANGRGVLNGVYEYLEADLGVRWYMPGELGEEVPLRTAVPLPSRSRSRTPAFSAIGGFIWAGGPGARDWERRVRARVGPASAFFGHNWGNIIPATPQNKAEHPEWFALNGGTRTHQLCTAHPDVVRITVEKARAFFDNSPTAEVFSISPNDGYGFCEDSRCKAVDQLYPGGNLSDRLVHYANAVLDELGRTHPGKGVGILAYVDHTPPPVVARPHPGYVTLLTHMPWEFCHAHPIEDPSCPTNARFLRYLEGWRATAAHVGVYDYYGHFYAFTPWPIVHSMRNDLRLFHRLGVDRFMSETQQHWATQGLNFYVGAKLAWDPSLDVDALLAEYYSRFYGRAERPMKAYWECWEQAMVRTAAPEDYGYQWQRMFTPEQVSSCGAFLAEAETLARGDREKVVKRVALARSGFDFTEAWTRMRAHADRGEWALALSSGEDAIRRLESTAGTEPQAFYISLAVQQTRAQMDPFRAALAAQ